MLAVGVVESVRTTATGSRQPRLVRGFRACDAGRCWMPTLEQIDARLVELSEMHGVHDVACSTAANEVWTTRLNLLLDERLRLTKAA